MMNNTLMMANEMTLDMVKDRIYKTLVSPVYHKDKLKTCPHRKWKDLAICYRIKIDDKYIGFITYNTARHLGVTEKDLYKIAKVEEIQITPMMQMMLALGGADYKYSGNADENFLVMTSKTNGFSVYGASVLLNRKEFIKKVKADCYLIPSSIHEFLLLNPKVMDVDAVKAMVCDVNKEVVEERERLNDTIYYYNAKKKSITVL